MVPAAAGQARRAQVGARGPGHGAFGGGGFGRGGHEGCSRLGAGDTEMSDVGQGLPGGFRVDAEVKGLILLQREAETGNPSGAEERGTLLPGYPAWGAEERWG